MKYFIPSWYHNETWWRDSATPFYEKNKVSEFDDMVSLLNMYKKNEASFNIMCLNYTSDFRMFLYRNNLYGVEYWSLFDELQGFKDVTPYPLDYRDFDWPKDTEFLFTPFVITCITGANEKSSIHFSEEGYLMWIENFTNDMKRKRYIFDDRGMLSSIMTFDDFEEPSVLEYITINGDYILKEDLKTNKVNVNAAYSENFTQSEYKDMTEVIKEYLNNYLKMHLDEEDRFIIASDKNHNSIISSMLSKDKLCFMIFSKRNHLLEEIENNYLDFSKYWIVDSQAHENLLANYIDEQKLNINFMRITPFDAQILPNISSQLHTSYIGFNIDGLEINEIKRVLNYLSNYIKTNDNVKLKLLTRYTVESWPQRLLDDIAEINEMMNVSADNEEIITEIKPIVEDIITIDYIPSETALVKAIKTLRIIIDVNQEPDLYLQISAISAGIPQINTCKTDYVKDKLNGYNIAEYEELGEALNYFLNHLIHWNYSFSYAIKLVDTYSAFNIINQLDAFIEGETNGKKI